MHFHKFPLVSMGRSDRFAVIVPVERLSLAVRRDGTDRIPGAVQLTRLPNRINTVSAVRPGIVAQAHEMWRGGVRLNISVAVEFVRVRNVSRYSPI